MADAIELLAPAGDPDKLRLAVQYGADAVYLSLRDFSLRAAGGNFTPDQLGEAVTWAHERGVRVYLALNYLAHPADLERMEPVLRSVLATDSTARGPDAVIVSDPGVFSLVHGQWPDLRIHISTQASVMNAASCRFWYDQGASRIILARELSLAEIGQIRAAVPPELELEAFAHGAMCMAYSGRCLLSNHLSGRDANRGRCSQPCRWLYEVREYRPDRPEEAAAPLLVETDQKASYIFNSKDLCMIEHIPEMAKAGLTSLKIEGRARSGFYVATAVKAYREALDSYQAGPADYVFDPSWLADLNKTTHRRFDTGFYFAAPQEDARIDENDTAVHEAAVVGLVRAWLPASGLALVEQRNKISEGEWLELVQPQGRHLAVQTSGLLDLERQPIAATPHPRMLYYMPLPEPVPPGAFLRRIGDKDSIDPD